MINDVEKSFLTHANGAPVSDNLNVQTAGPRGPVLLQDVWLIEKLAHFSREVIPERRMHAKGAGAFGTFTVTHDVSQYTKARLFSEVGKRTDTVLRFSTVAGERGAADAERDIRGFALRFYTDEGNWDIVGNNTPVFFFRDPLRFIDLNHAIKRDPYTGMRSADSNWDFWSLLPEALHQVTIVMSERGIPRSYRHMHGFGSHTYSFINAENVRTWVKFHFRSQQGIENLTDQEAAALIGADRESHHRDLFESIERGEFPRWKLFIQVMTDEKARSFRFNPFDLTKVWPKKEFPLIEVGVLELNRNPENVFADIEQAAFTPANVIPGVGYSPDKMLQARLFSYGDAHRYRLGTNHHHIPVNAPRCPYHSFHRDGAMRTDGNLGRTTSYWPNSKGEWTDQPALNEPPLEWTGVADHWDHRIDDDHYQQPGDLFRMMTSPQRQALFDNTARAMGDARAVVKQRHIDNCAKADPAYGAGVAAAVANWADGSWVGGGRRRDGSSTRVNTDSTKLDAEMCTMRTVQKFVVRQIILVSVLLLVSALPGLTDEQTVTVVVRPGQSEADVGRALDLAAKAGMPVRLELSDKAAPSPAFIGKQPVMPLTPEMVATNIGMRSWESVTSAIWRGATVAWSGLWAVTAMMSMTKASLSAEGSDVGDAVLATGASMMVGAFVAGLVGLFLMTASRKRGRAVDANLFRVACCRLAADLLLIALFFGFSRFSLQHLLEPSGIAHQVSRCVLASVMVSLVYVAVARLLFKSSVGRAPLLNIENPAWHFKMLVLHGVITAIVTETIRLAYVLGMNPGAIDGWFLIGNTVLTLQKLIWFIVGRAGIRDVFIGRDAGFLRRVAGGLLPELYIGAAVVIWLAGFLVAGTPESTRWSFAAGTTQVILLAAPIFARGSVLLFDETVGIVTRSLEHRWWSAVFASLRVLLSAGAWIACLHLIIALWTPLMVGDAEVLASWISWLEQSSIAVVVSWAVCTLILRYFDCVAPVQEIFMPGQDDDHGRKAASRFSTALPVAKNLAMGGVLALAGLLTLKSAGLDIAPLLAGFGVVGLALSFGSQALVRDVVSGIFFIADDAFRIGEYIETGALRGTVEQITLRSVRLRHHNGPVHTIPFGQINSVTNLSRDWGTIKLELGFDRDVDIDMIRKVAKRVGLDMLSDPEFGADFILPLKMQGIQDLTETSMVIRFKFTSRPGNPGLIKREAMKRLIFAFRERGLPFASNSVTVRSNGQDGTSADLELAAAASLRPTTALAI